MDEASSDFPAPDGERGEPRRGADAARDEVAAIVLAAGAGTRFGSPKAMVDFRGELLVERAIRLAASGGCRPVFVVLGAGSDDVLARADLASAQVVLAPDWAEGLGASLRAGLDAASRADVSAAAVLLVDQPLVGPGSLARLRSAWANGAVAAVATYGGEPRHPVLFDRSIFTDVATGLEGDAGARHWLRARADQVTLVACDETGDPFDVDTLEDLATLLEETR